MAMYRRTKNTQTVYDSDPTDYTDDELPETEYDAVPDSDEQENESDETEAPEYDEDRAAAIFEDDELQYLWCYVNQVSLQGRLYFKDEIKVDDTTISNKVASFNLLIKKKTKNGVKRHRIYVKTYNKDIIEWLTHQEVGTWVKVEGRLEAASNKTYVNATSITSFSEERIKAIFEMDDVAPNVDWTDYDKTVEPEINKKAMQKLKQIKQQTRQLAANANSVYVDDEDSPVAASAARGALTEDDIAEITTKTKNLVASYKAYISALEAEEEEEEEEEYDRPYVRRTSPLYEEMRRYPARPVEPSLRGADPETLNQFLRNKGYLEDEPVRKITREKLDAFDFADFINDEPFSAESTDNDLPDDYDDEDEEISASPVQTRSVTSTAPTQPELPPQPVPQAAPPQAAPPQPAQEDDMSLPAGAKLVRSEPFSLRRVSGRTENRSERRYRSRYNR